MIAEMMLAGRASKTAHKGFDFANGYCREFAVALHETFKYPMEATVEHEFTTGEPTGVIHAYCVVDPQEIVEVSGIKNYDKVIQQYEAISTEGVWARIFIKTKTDLERWPDAPKLNPAAVQAAREYIAKYRARFVDNRD